MQSQDSDIDEPNEKRKTTSSDQKAVAAMDVDMDEQEEDEEIIYRPKRNNKGRRKMVESSMDEDEDQNQDMLKDDDEEIPSAKKKASNANKRPLNKIEDSNSLDKYSTPASEMAKRLSEELTDLTERKFQPAAPGMKWVKVTKTETKISWCYGQVEFFGSKSKERFQS